MINIVDLFAGPGGLAEGFCSVCTGRDRDFKVHLSVENEDTAFKTLSLRSFFRQFPVGDAPDAYYSFLKGDITADELYGRWPVETALAQSEILQATLGEYSYDELDARISLIERNDPVVLIGGPPCQAYSVAGRSGNKLNSFYSPLSDSRYFLYKEYIRVLGVHSPEAFVMENVKGMLSAKINGERIIDNILDSLRNPSAFMFEEFGQQVHIPGYRLYSLTDGYQCEGSDPSNFLVQTELMGLPQSRHRVIIIGVREDIHVEDFPTIRTEPAVSVRSVLSDLPVLRSKISRGSDSDQIWADLIADAVNSVWLDEVECMWGEGLSCRIKDYADIVVRRLKNYGSQVVGRENGCAWNAEWYTDPRLDSVLHHESRSHMSSDIWRYFFCSAFAEEFQKSPKISDFPESLLPNHKNTKSGKFSDRFRVQLAGQPSKTIISHLSKDGHAFIHYDPEQSRSLTPREAARLQTFPDNYYFFGGNSFKFRQIGNAVPPLLAKSIAEILRAVLN